ncbi:uncharacterized protein LOC141821675 [Curcuma longa]|uniref:uncharacterized protein LOC141821675 n=1 Tax=Curcuma longa TaxID=136217 RepID=UPI003D9E8F56
MAPPRNLREAQRLVGRITALSRFISRSAERNLPFFKILRKAQRFEWNAECDKAFEELKEYLNQLPRQAKPLPGEPLWMYLSATDSAVSSVLVKDEGQNQQPIYFSSHLLKDAETRYTGLEKLAWILVLSARRLRPYFLSHPITVLTNSNLGRVLTQPEASGRLIKWTVELGEYDIQYQPRTAIKAQALADFLVEIPKDEAEEEWKVYVDGSSNKQGSGVGVLLVSPKGEEIRLAIQLSFKASNNEAEYEAVLAGLQAAKRMGAARILLRSDSQLRSPSRRSPEPRTVKPTKLARMASSVTEWTDEEAITQVAFVAQIDQTSGSPEPNDWRTPILAYLQTGETPSDPDQVRLLKRRASSIHNNRRSVVPASLLTAIAQMSWARGCRLRVEGSPSRLLRQPSRRPIVGAESPSSRILLADPSSGSAKLVSTCLHCQKYQPFSKHPTEQLKAATIATIMSIRPMGNGYSRTIPDWSTAKEVPVGRRRLLL